MTERTDLLFSALFHRFPQVVVVLVVEGQCEDVLLFSGQGAFVHFRYLAGVVCTIWRYFITASKRLQVKYSLSE